MKKIKTLLLSSLLLGSVVMADSFGELGIGYSKGNNSDDFVTVHGSLNAIGNIGARLEYTKNITENPQFSKEDIKRYGLFATYTLPILPNMSLTPKIGLVKTDGSFEVVDTFKTITESSTNFTYGLELNYDVNDKMSIFVGYTDYGNELDIDDFDTSKLDTANYTFGLKIHL
jgi:opacity protein-like surface antigen